MKIYPRILLNTLPLILVGFFFVGSLAYFLAAGKPLTEAMDRANQIAAVSVQSSGTQSSFPTAAELPPGLLE